MPRSLPRKLLARPSDRSLAGARAYRHLVAILAFATDQFFTVANLFNLLNTSSVNLIFAVGLLVVLISGGIDISFAVAASVVQYVAALCLDQDRRRRLDQRPRHRRLRSASGSARSMRG